MSRWTPAEDAHLTLLVTRGLSAKQISDSHITHRTRNAVVSRVTKIPDLRLGRRDGQGSVLDKEVAIFNREEEPLKIGRVPAPSRVPKKLLRKSKNSVTVAVVPPKKAIHVGGQHLARITELRPRSCKYPEERGDDGEWLLCGRNRCNDHSPYCKEHHEVCYRVRERQGVIAFGHRK